MKLNFENFYAFEFTLGFLGVITGFYLLNVSLLFTLLILGSSFLILNSVMRWNKSQKNKEKLENIILDFDIKDIRAERDIDWYPDDIIDGQPIGFNTEYTAEYKITLNVYNPCIVENVIRKINVSVINKKKKKNCNKNITSNEDVNRIPVPIIPRNHKNLVFSVSVDDWYGEIGDNIEITLISIDNKKITKRRKIDYYYDGPNFN